MTPFDLTYQPGNDPLLVGVTDRHHLLVQPGRPTVHLPFDKRTVRNDFLRLLQQFELPVQVDKEVRRNSLPPAFPARNCHRQVIVRTGISSPVESSETIIPSCSINRRIRFATAFPILLPPTVLSMREKQKSARLL